MPRPASRPEFSDLHRQSREESRRQDSAHSTHSAKGIALSLVPSFLRCNKDSPSKEASCRDRDSRAASKYRRSTSRHPPQENELSPSFDTKNPLGSTTSRRRQSVSGSALHTGFSEISGGGIGLMVNIFGESSKEDKPTKGHKRGISLTLRSHVGKPEWDDSSDDEWSGNESLESNKARVGRRPAPVQPSLLSRRSQSGSRRPRDTSLTSPILSSSTDYKKSQQATNGHQAVSAATSTGARGPDKSYKRRSQCSDKSSRQSSTRERRSSVSDKLSSTRGKEKEKPFMGRMAPKSPDTTLKKENAPPPEMEIPPRYDTTTHVCYCCGKTRSKNYQFDHPIDAKLGAKPSLCGPCSYNIASSGNLPGRLEHKRVYLSGLHWCAICGTLRSTKFHLTHQRLGSKSNLPKICAVYETGPDKEDVAPARNSNRASQKVVNSPEASPSCTSVDSPNPNYPSSDDEAPTGRKSRPALRSILVNTSISVNDRDTGHSDGTAWVSKNVSDSSFETHVHFTNPEISGLTEVPNYDRSPIELDYPGHATQPSPMIPSARRAQPATEQPSTETSSSPDFEPPHVPRRPTSQHGAPKGMGETDAPTRDTAPQGHVRQKSNGLRPPAPPQKDVRIPPRDAQPPRPSYTHNPEPSYQPAPAHDGRQNNPSNRWSAPEHHPVRETSIPAKSHRHSADYSDVRPQFHHSNLPEIKIEPFSGYCGFPPPKEGTRPLSGYCSPHVDDYYTTPNSSTDTFGLPRSPNVAPEPPHMRGGPPPQSYSFVPPGHSPGPSPGFSPGPNPEDTINDATFFAPPSDPSSTHSSQTIRPNGSGYFSANPSPVFSSNDSRGPSPNTDSSADQAYHAFSSDAQRRAESQARMFAAAGFAAASPEEEEAGLKQETVLQTDVWEVQSEEAAEIEREHVARMGGGYVNTSFQV